MFVRKPDRSLDKPYARLGVMEAEAVQPRAKLLRTLDYVYAELLLCASLSCATAGTVQACRRGEDLGPGVLHAFLPPAPSAFPAVVGCIMSDVELRELARTLEEHYTLQGAARCLTEICQSFDGDRCSAEECIEHVAIAWQEVARSALRSLEELDCALPHSLHAPRAKQLRDALVRVRSGDQVDQSECGLSSLPETGEKRGQARTVVSTYVLIERGTSLQKILVTDVSRRGLGLTGLSDANPGEVMRILWKPGAALVARVSWVHDDRFGLEIVEHAALADDFIRSLIDEEPLPTPH